MKLNCFETSPAQKNNTTILTPTCKCISTQLVKKYVMSEGLFLPEKEYNN